MISVILIWAGIFLTVFPAGTAILVLTERLSGRTSEISSVYTLRGSIAAGLCFAAVYAQTFSLFHGVGAGAFVLLLVLNGAAFCFFFKECRSLLFRSLQGSVQGSAQGKGGRLHICIRIVSVCLLILLAALLTSTGYMHYDSDLYHAQTIRWIEEYGAVKGLANLHSRLGYNSAALVLSALYSFFYIGGQSYHAVNGFLALVLLLESLEIRTLFTERRNAEAADFGRLSALYYLFTVSDEIMAPATDYTMALVTFYLVIRYLVYAGERQKEPEDRNAFIRFSLLAVLAVFCVSMKLSAALLLLVTVYPVYLMIRDGKASKIPLFLVMGILVLLPFLIRNVILTGYLAYPFPGIDLFDVPWKVPAGAALGDAREIMVWGRGYSDPRLYDLSIRAWGPAWFSALSGTDKLFVAADIAAIPVCCLWFIAEFRKKRARLSLFVIWATLGACVLFWLLTSPLIRYGCVFVYSFALVSAGMIAVPLLENRAFWQSALKVLVLLFLLYKVLAVGRQELRFPFEKYLITQQDYGHYTVREYEVDGHTFYYPEGTDQCGYDAFPSSPTNRSGKISLLGADIEDGFRALD